MGRGEEEKAGSEIKGLSTCITPEMGDDGCNGAITQRI